MTKFTNILLATKNVEKIREFKFIASDVFNFVTLLDLKDTDRVVEDGTNYYENAYKKAIYYFQKYKMPTLAEDSGIEVEALNGQPGIYSHRFAGENATDKNNNNKILELLNDIKDFEKRKAKYIACCVFILPKNPGNRKDEDVNLLTDIQTVVAYGSCCGYINFTQIGENGFGYDPLFYYPTFNKTFAQVSLEEKSQVSHRADAIRNLISQLK